MTPGVPDQILIIHGFQSTSPAGDDSVYGVMWKPSYEFQSTSPAGDDSLLPDWLLIALRNFNPHLPQEMTLITGNSWQISPDFNPHLPQEMTRKASTKRIWHNQFQSTSPAGDDSAAVIVKPRRPGISIHISRRR